MTRNCLNCAKEFTPRKAHVERGMGLYCSRACHYAHKRSLPVQDWQPRFWAKVDKNGPLWNGTPCWLWTGAKDKHGYGSFARHKGKGGEKAYAVSYELERGPVPVGLQLDHLCRNPSCVNHGHLEAVPQAVNIARGVSPPANNARATYCVAGHEFTPENTYMWGPKKAWRGCQACRDRRNAISNAKKGKQ